MSTWNTKETNSFRPTVYYCSKATSCDLKYIIFAIIVELCVKHLIWHTCAISIKETWKVFADRISQDLSPICLYSSSFFASFANNHWTDSTSESKCFPSIKEWKNSLLVGFIIPISPDVLRMNLTIVITNMVMAIVWNSSFPFHWMC